MTYHRLIDIFFSVLTGLAFIEQHNGLFAGIAGICACIYWAFKFSEWIALKLKK